MGIFNGILEYDGWSCLKMGDWRSKCHFFCGKWWPTMRWNGEMGCPIFRQTQKLFQDVTDDMFLAISTCPCFLSIWGLLCIYRLFLAIVGMFGGCSRPWSWNARNQPQEYPELPETARATRTYCGPRRSNTHICQFFKDFPRKKMWKRVLQVVSNGAGSALCARFFSMSLVSNPGSTVSKIERERGRSHLNRSASQWRSSSLTGWWYTYPSEKYEFVSWDDEVPKMMGKIKFMFQRTNQLSFMESLLLDLPLPGLPALAQRIDNPKLSPAVTIRVVGPVGSSALPG